MSAGDPLPLLAVEERCPVCGDERVRALHVYPNALGRISTRADLVLAGCANCGMAWSSPLPSQQEVEAFYAGDSGWGDRPGLSAQRAATKDAQERTERKLAAKRAIYEHESDLLLAELDREPGAVLDIGCGLGTWLDVLADRGWSTAGVEPNPTARATAARRHRMLDAPPEQPEFDLVLLQHVLEHLRDPLATMRQVAAATRPGGHVFVSVPDLGRVHVHRKVSYATSGVHLFAHTVEGLRSLMALAGFELVRHLDDPAWDRDEARHGRHLKALGRRVELPLPLAPDPLAAAVSSLRELARVDPELGVAPEPTTADKLRDLVGGGWRRRRARRRYRGR
jgi:2-polyprenyl-3-methyl-5-hydroxy-6-metoxy-1,4-benzoquinol methylase